MSMWSNAYAICKQVMSFKVASLVLIISNSNIVNVKHLLYNNDLVKTYIHSCHKIKQIS